MISNILNNKTVITKPNGEEIVDLTTKCINYSSEQPLVIDSFYVADDAVMRPDLVSNIAYGTTDYFDYILKFNSISNPFSIDKDMYISVPDLRYMEDSLNQPKKTDVVDAVRKQYLDPSKGGTVDPKRLEFNQAIKELRQKSNSTNFTDYPFPPNLAQPGSKEGRATSDGKVTLGGDV